jgi:hypothetical protein
MHDIKEMTMGIDIYATWDGMTSAERELPLDYIWSIAAGHLGYLREAYHGGPYVTHFLCQESFAQPDGAAISAATLRQRLPRACQLARERYRNLSQGIEDPHEVERGWLRQLAEQIGAPLRPELDEEDLQEEGTPLVKIGCSTHPDIE